MGLRRKRARLSGEVAALEAKVAPLREALAQVDALLRLSDGGNPELIPPIRPAQRCLFFRHGELSRLCREALRDGPHRAAAVAAYVIAAKGIPDDERAVREKVTEIVRISLHRMERRGSARRVVREPEVWSEGVG